MRATRRAPTLAEKRAITQRQDGECFLENCHAPIAVFEHWTMVAIGNDGPPDCGLCEAHADIKTYGGNDSEMWRAVGGDIRDIHHTRRLAEKRTQHDRRNERGSQMRSRGFDKTRSKKFNGEVVSRG